MCKKVCGPAGYDNRLPASDKKPKKRLSAAQRFARARKAAPARWEPAKRWKKNVAASALAKLRWAKASEEDIQATVAKMIEARKQRRNTDYRWVHGSSEGSSVLFRSVLLALAFAIGLPGQYAAIAREPEPLPDKRQSAPEPRRRLSTDPDALFARLLSPNPAEREAAFNSIGMEFIAKRDPQDIRFFAVNIDSDPEPERVFIGKSYLDVEAVVLKRDNDGWWALAGFVCCGPGSGLIEPFLELRQTVWYGTNDIIVHAGGKQGTGVGERRLMIYRAFTGQLYKVLDIVESAYNLSGSEDIRIAYPDTDSSSSPRVITVHRTKRAQSRRTTACELYRWDADKFTFARTAPDPRFCRSH